MHQMAKVKLSQQQLQLRWIVPCSIRSLHSQNSIKCLRAGNIRRRNISAQASRRKTWQINQMNTISETLIRNLPFKVIICISKAPPRLPQHYKDSFHSQSLIRTPTWASRTQLNHKASLWQRILVSGRTVSLVLASLAREVNHLVDCKHRHYELMFNRPPHQRLTLAARSAIKRWNRSQLHYRTLTQARDLSSAPLTFQAAVEARRPVYLVHHTMIMSKAFT